MKVKSIDDTDGSTGKNSAISKWCSVFYNFSEHEILLRNLTELPAGKV